MRVFHHFAFDVGAIFQFVWLLSFFLCVLMMFFLLLGPFSHVSSPFLSTCASLNAPFTSPTYTFPHLILLPSLSISGVRCAVPYNCRTTTCEHGSLANVFACGPCVCQGFWSGSNCTVCSLVGQCLNGGKPDWLCNGCDCPPGKKRGERKGVCVRERDVFKRVCERQGQGQLYRVHEWRAV